MTTAMNSFLALGGNELVNAARLKEYVRNGIFPKNFHITPRGCDGLDAILPCVDSDPPLNGYRLPELDPAPWYDAAAPESANFAGLLVTEVTMSAPYTRTVSQNINQGQTLGRLKKQGRTIVVRGWLVAKTCCAAQYGKLWLTSALGGLPCGSPGECSGTDLEFLDCCPSVGTAEGDCLTTGDGVFVRPDADSEYQRAEEFFRRMHGVGITDGPNILSERGSNCGCGSAPLVEVEFTLATSSPYLHSFGTPIITNAPAPTCEDEGGLCSVNWVKVAPGEPCPEGDCPTPADCLEDPLCPLPALPPVPAIPTQGCGGGGCTPVASARLCASVTSVREWGSATLNIEVRSGSRELRNLAIRVWQNPRGFECGNSQIFPDCDACTTLVISYIPANSTFILSGENRTVTVDCNGSVRSATQNITNIDGQPFDWPDLECVSACVCADFSCTDTAPDATVSITRVDRSL